MIQHALRTSPILKWKRMNVASPYLSGIVSTICARDRHGENNYETNLGLRVHGYANLRWVSHLLSVPSTGMSLVALAR